MSDQPIIVEDSPEVKPQRAAEETQQSKFFELLDEVEEYDRISTSIRQKYQGAMIALASVKFNTPHALNVSSHKCVPSFLKASPKGSLVQEYSTFTNQVLEEEVYPDEYEQHHEIEQECLLKQKQLASTENQGQRQQIIQNELLRRFNVANHQQQVLGISKQFRDVIGLLLQLEEFKTSFEGKLKKMEKR